MKRIVLIISLSLVLISLSYSQNERLGLGIVLGEPVGISAKLKTGFNNAYDFAAAWSARENRTMLLQADYVWNNFDHTNVESGSIPLYYGLGVRLIFTGVPKFGVRFPIGLNNQFTTAPVDIFAELVPILDLIPSARFNFGAGLGARFWIK
jgi:hypothetical protein